MTKSKPAPPAPEPDAPDAALAEWLALGWWPDPRHNGFQKWLDGAWLRVRPDLGFPKQWRATLLGRRLPDRFPDADTAKIALYEARENIKAFGLLD